MEIRGSVTVKSTASDPVTRRGNRSGSYALQAFANSLGLKIEHGAHENEGHGGVNIGLDPVPGILDFSLSGAGYAVKIAHGLHENGEKEAAFEGFLVEADRVAFPGGGADYEVEVETEEPEVVKGLLFDILDRNDITYAPQKQTK